MEGQELPSPVGEVYPFDGNAWLDQPEAGIGAADIAYQCQFGHGQFSATKAARVQ